MEGKAVTERPAICEEFPTLAVAAARQLIQQQPEAPAHHAGSFLVTLDEGRLW